MDGWMDWWISIAISIVGDEYICVCGYVYG